MTGRLAACACALCLVVLGARAAPVTGPGDPGAGPPPGPLAQADGATPGSVPGFSTAGGGHYGPVRANDTLWSLAARLRIDDSVSVQRMMLALLEANPRAFTIRNVNALIVGSTLRIPARSEIGPDDREAAIAEIRHQNAVWKRFRESQGLRGAPAGVVPAAAALPLDGPAGGDIVQIA